MGAPFIFIIGAWVAMAPFMYLIQGIGLVFELIAGTFMSIFNKDTDTEEPTTDAIS